MDLGVSRCLLRLTPASKGQPEDWPQDDLDATWKCVKGHAGHPENERVDGLANGEAERAAVGASNATF